MTAELRFPRTWDATILGDGHPDFRFSTVDTSPSAGRALTVAVQSYSMGRNWVGLFEGATRLSEAAHGVFSFPDPDSLFVIASGQGYLVSSEAPETWQSIDECPITGITDIPELGTIVISDLLCVAGYGADGRLWRSDRLAYDGIKLLSADVRSIEGLAWSAPEEGYVPFTVDPVTGAHTGGDAP